jgi:hypothetical protein
MRFYIWDNSIYHQRILSHFSRHLLTMQSLSTSIKTIATMTMIVLTSASKKVLSELSTKQQSIEHKTSFDETTFVVSMFLRRWISEKYKRSIIVVVQYWDKRKSKFMIKINSSSLSSFVVTLNSSISSTSSTYANMRHKTSYSKSIIFNRLRFSNVSFHSFLFSRFSSSFTDSDIDDFSNLKSSLDISNRTTKKMFRDREMRFDEFLIKTTHFEANSNEHASFRRSISMNSQLRMNVLSTEKSWNCQLKESVERLIKMLNEHFRESISKVRIIDVALNFVDLNCFVSRFDAVHLFTSIIDQEKTMNIIKQANAILIDIVVFVSVDNSTIFISLVMSFKSSTVMSSLDQKISSTVSKKRTRLFIFI